MRRFASSLTGIMAAVILLGWTAASAVSRPLDDVVESGVLNVIVYYDNSPFSWDGKDGEVTGIDADVGRAIAREMNLKANVIARIAGEEVDDDLRSNIWQGPRTGGIKGDVMMHVPMDRELIARNNLVMISNPYYHEQVVIAVDEGKVGTRGLDAFREHKVAVRFSNSAHYFLTFANEGAFRNNVSPWMKFKDAAEYFRNGEAAGLAGPRSEVEAALDGHKGKVNYLVPEMPDTLRSSWTIGMAVNHDSRDLGYAIGKALRKIKASGELAEIFTKYGVGHVPPPVR